MTRANPNIAALTPFLGVSWLSVYMENGLRTNHECVLFRITDRHFEHDDVVARINRGQTTASTIVLVVPTVGVLYLSNNSALSSELGFERFRATESCS